MPCAFDLHTHSLVSDGMLTPSDLVLRAQAAGVAVLALTDHDDTAGLAEAADAARSCGLTLVPGVEISVTWESGLTVHVVGLGIDPAHPPLADGLERLREFRDWRAVEIGRRLAARGIEGAYEGAHALARGRIVSRTHFARHLLSRGCGATINDVFKHYLRRNKPGYVPGQWAELGEAVDWIVGSGGIAVLAHPARYDLTASKLKRLAREFMTAGGEAIEVISGSHSPDDNLKIARLAAALGLYGSAGSDFHDPDNPWVALGRLQEPPPAVTPVWQSPRWKAPAAAAINPVQC